MKATLAITLFALFIYNVKSQEVEQNPIDTLTTSVQKLQSDFILLKKLKIYGYVQAQFQTADSMGISSFAGGSFPINSDKRFMVRRGRLKAAYDNGLSLFVLQFDITEKGMGIKDAYMKITEPWMKAVSLTTGVFDRPFGFEISYSSSSRETPERTRLFQTIFPGERDLGAKITIQAPKTSKWNFLKIEGGLFNGTGGTASDFDYKKDFIGNIGINKTTKNEKINYAVRASYYNGGYRQPTKYIYNGFETLTNGNLGYSVDSTSTNKGKIAKREYIGADAQINIDFPFGLTSLRGEFIQGTQPGTSLTSASPSDAPTTDTYIRKFNGAYFYFLQNIMQTKHQFVLKYDWYDPNTNVSGDEIGKSGSKLNNNDLKYTTIGIGWVYRWDTNVKITAYYDFVKNETSKNLAGYTKDLKDNVFTLRIQYKF
ncbi:MAG: hypothetical protein A2X08_04815 [Bacteroidetes bacterium GWA2_32_17]|nr:MAG: hypothetical protein A2X08_04815 [Bacteroidetes bacterium GWA2_32_17]